MTPRSDTATAVVHGHAEEHRQQRDEDDAASDAHDCAERAGAGRAEQRE